MPLLPKGSSYSATIGDAPIFAGRRATAQDFGAPGLGETGLVEAGHRVTATAKAELSDLEENEQRKALVSSTEVRAEYARKLDEAALDGSDLSKLKEEMAADLAKIGEQFVTKKGTDQLQLYSANSAIMYDQQANSIAVQRAWSEARLQGQSLIVNASKIIQGNPSYLPVAEASVDDLLATYKNIRPDQKAELKQKLTQDLNMAAAMSAARIEPAQAVKDLEGGKWNLSDEQRRQGISYAEHNLNTRRAAEEREVHRVEKERRDKADLQRDSYTQRILAGDLGKRLEKDIISDPAFAHYPQYREHLVTFMRADAQRLAGQEKRSDEVTKRDLFMRLTAPEGSADKLYNADAVHAALKEGKLNVTDSQFLFGVASGRKNEIGQKFSSRLGVQLTQLRMAMANDPRTKAYDAETVAGIQNILATEALRRSEEITGGKDGPARSADGMFDMKSKDFFFKPGLIKDAADAVRKLQRENLEATTPDMRKDPTAWKGLKAGQMVINPKGDLVPVTQATLDALAKSGGKADVAAPKEPPAPEDAYVAARNRRGEGGGFVIERGARGPAGLKALQGQRYATREEARAAVKGVLEGGQ